MNAAGILQDFQTLISNAGLEHFIDGEWYVSNVSIIFDAPCLFFTPFALCFVTLRGVFMRFLELTY
jgi:hypothetical protein